MGASMLTDISHSFLIHIFQFNQKELTLSNELETPALRNEGVKPLLLINLNVPLRQLGVFISLVLLNAEGRRDPLKEPPLQKKKKIEQRNRPF